jgi:repressor LexA
MQKITDRQKAVLDFIANCIDERGYPPTLREIGNHLGIKSTNGVNDHLRALERKGFLTREDMKSRTLRPTPLALQTLGLPYAGGRSAAAASAGPLPDNVVPFPTRRPTLVDGGLADDRDDDLIDVPILGRVAAGLPQEAIEQAEDRVRIDRMLVGNHREVFGLRITGDSMIEAGIHDGDYVFVRKQLEARKGDIIVALVGEEATCKYFFPEADHIRLEPANAAMGPILVHRSDWRTTQVLGVVVGVYRKLD